MSPDSFSAEPTRSIYSARYLARYWIVCAVALAGFGCQAKADKPPEVKLPEVFVAHPTQETITEQEVFTGRIMAVETVEVRGRVSGYVDDIPFEDGADVKEGDLLFQIDPRPFKAEVDRATATIEQNEARLERLNRQQLRAEKLINKQAISAEDYDIIRFDVAETKATLAAAVAAKELTELNYNYTAIRAPISGRISRRLVDKGNLIKADDTLLATIVSLNPIYAYFDIDERTILRLRRMMQAGKIKSAQEAHLPVRLALADAAADKFDLHGTIDFVDNQVDPSTGTLRLRAVIDNTDQILAPGLFVRLQVPIGTPHEAVLVREEALGSDQGNRFVYVVDDKDEITYRRVKVGMLYAGQRVIEQGLTTADRVVVTGLQRIRPGSKVATKAWAEKETAASAQPGGGMSLVRTPSAK